MSRSEGELPWRVLGPMVFLPTFFYGVGMGVSIPVAAILAVSLGASAAAAAFCVGMLMLGQLVGTVPAGWIVTRIGERWAMVSASALWLVGASCCLVAQGAGVLAAGAFLIGVGAAVFGLARQAFVTVAIVPGMRGRAMSLVSMATRLGVLIGPFLAAAVTSLTGSVRYAFVGVAVSALCIVVTVLVVRESDDVRALSSAVERGTGDQRPGVLRTMVTSRDVLLKMGTSAMILSALRNSPKVVVPLWGLAIGLDAVDVALVVGLSTTLDFALTFLGGVVMDRWGMLAAGLPAMAVFSIGNISLALTRVVPNQVLWYVSTTVGMSIAAGLSGGFNATMGSLLAPVDKPAAFLSCFRLVSEMGPAGTPLIIGVATAAFGLAAATAIVGGIGLLGCGMLVRYVPRFLPTSRHRRGSPIAYGQRPA